MFDLLTNSMQTQQQLPESLGHTLRSLLIMPVQRIPRYNLLLQELLKETPDSHPDFANLTDALDSMRKVAEHVRALPSSFPAFVSFVTYGVCSLVLLTL